MKSLSSRDPVSVVMFLFFFNDTATTEIYTLSLHDALPIFADNRIEIYGCGKDDVRSGAIDRRVMATLLYLANSGLKPTVTRSEEHTSELQSRQYLVCRLLLEKKKSTH